MLRAHLPPLATLLLLTAGVASASATAARAGTYVVEQCQTPAGGAAPLQGWTYNIWAPSIDTVSDTCPRGGLRLTMNPNVTHPKADLIKAWWPAPADTKIVHYAFWRTVEVGAGTSYYATPIERTGTAETFTGKGCAGIYCPGLGDPANPLSDGNRVEGAPAQPIDAAGYYLSCGYSAPSDPDCGGSTPAVEVVLSRAEMMLSDDSAPAFAAPPIGPLVDTSTTLSGLQTVAVQATDKGGGIADAAIEVDGKVVSHGPLGVTKSTCAQPYTVGVPCPLAAGGALTLDTSTLTDSDHRLRLLLTDAAGNLTSWGPVTIRTYNTPPDTSCVPTPPVPSTTLTTGLMLTPLKKAKPKPAVRTLRVGYGRHSQLVGRLRDPGGAPVGGQPICVVSRTDGESGAYATLARATTGADGTFAVPVPSGPSRQLGAIYRVGAGAVMATTRLLVVPRVTVHLHRGVVHNGHRMIITGQLGGGPFPQRGVRLNMQVVKDGGWSGFGDPFRTDSRGRFRFTYRFRYTYSVERYRLRLRAYAQAGYPYVTGYSRRLTVRVTP